MRPGAEPNLPERRRAARFPIAIPVELEEGMGTTRNVSLSGVLFEAERPFAPGEQLRLVLVLERVSPGHPVRLQCEGRVVRVTRLNAKTEVAVAITSYRFGAQGQPVGLA